jgi:hypothetical protein
VRDPERKVQKSQRIEQWQPINNAACSDSATAMRS